MHKDAQRGIIYSFNKIMNKFSANNRVLSKLRYNHEWNIIQLLKWLENLHYTSTYTNA